MSDRELDTKVHRDIFGKSCHSLDREILLPYYSTDIAAAWLVVEKMRDDDFWWAAAYKETLVEGIYQAGYSVTFRCVRAGTRGDHTATALILSEAICRAALMAAEAE